MVSEIMKEEKRLRDLNYAVLDLFKIYFILIDEQIKSLRNRLNTFCVNTIDKTATSGDFTKSFNEEYWNRVIDLVKNFCRKEGLEPKKVVEDFETEKTIRYGDE